VGEAARKDDDVHPAQIAVAVPEELGLAAGAGDGLHRVVLAVGAREHHHADAVSQR